MINMVSTSERSHIFMLAGLICDLTEVFCIYLFLKFRDELCLNASKTVKKLC